MMNSNSTMHVDPLSWLESQIELLNDRAPEEDCLDKSVEIIPLATTARNGYNYELLAVETPLVPNFEQLFSDIKSLAQSKGVGIDRSLRIVHELLNIVARLEWPDDELVVMHKGVIDTKLPMPS